MMKTIRRFYDWMEEHWILSLFLGSSIETVTLPARYLERASLGLGWTFLLIVAIAVSVRLLGTRESSPS